MRIPSPPPRALDDPVPEGLAFRFRQGALARSLVELLAALEGASASDVAFHGEHLVPWTRDVLRDEPLALRIGSFARQGMAPDILRETLLALVRRRVDELKRA